MHLSSQYRVPMMPAVTKCIMQQYKFGAWFEYPWNDVYLNACPPVTP